MLLDWNESQSEDPHTERYEAAVCYVSLTRRREACLRSGYVSLRDARGKLDLYLDYVFLVQGGPSVL